MTTRTKSDGNEPIAGHGSKFSRKMDAVIAALLSHGNHEEAARAAGVSRRTLNRYQKVPEFRVAYLEARRAVMFQANARLQQAASAAVSTLVKVMVDPSTPAAARVRAADCILARANQGLENEDYDLRIAALERLEKPDSRLERIEAILGVADLPRAA